ncbi:TetR/AcrR family transcriptional regulator [Janibacter sp. GS2]|uniref:TetR/AcrR family transcriptional regulator n=1 Tax=Janibacter sp. GS2 TaxID=3442646 RepID=UPI003EBCC00D
MSSPEAVVPESRERIRSAALALFASQGVGATSLREVAREAGVTPGLVGHHFGSKAGLHTAVDDHVVALFRDALESVPLEGVPEEVVAARDRAITRMLEDHPDALGYLRRAVLTPEPGVGHLARGLVEETIRQATQLRERGIARSRYPVAEQAVAELVRQLGNRMFQPMLDHLWKVAGAETTPPTVRVGFRRDGD